MGRGGWHGGGRPHAKEAEKRQPLHDFRLPKKWIRFLKSYPRQGSRMIEQALAAAYQAQFDIWQAQQQNHD